MKKKPQPSLIAPPQRITPGRAYDPRVAHVVPQDGRWAVVQPGAVREWSTHATQEAALERAREIVSARDGVVVLDGHDGTAQQREQVAATRGARD